jgi:hypothetical protein
MGQRPYGDLEAWIATEQAGGEVSLDGHESRKDAKGLLEIPVAKGAAAFPCVTSLSGNLTRSRCQEVACAAQNQSATQGHVAAMIPKSLLAKVIGKSAL